MNAPGSGAHWNRRILVVDDNPSIQGDFRKILAKQTNPSPELDDLESVIFGQGAPRQQPRVFEVDLASQGQEAAALVLQAQRSGRPYSLAFVDVRMPPGWDGIETTTHLWSIDPDLQIVICTAYSDYSWEQTIQRLGESDRLLILKKPFDAVEVQQLAHALTEKWSLQREAQALLEQTRQRNRDLRLVLDNVEQGLLRLDRDGIMLPERSAAVDAWLGPHCDGQTFWACIREHDLRTAAMFKLAFGMLCQGDLPLEVCLEQMPRRLLLRGRTLALSYRPISRDGTAVPHSAEVIDREARSAAVIDREARSAAVIDQVLLVLSDITGRLEHEQLEADQRDMLRAFEKLIANRDTFADFLADADRLVRRLAGSRLPVEEERRMLHTLKGNCGIFGLEVMAGLCHEIEDRLCQYEAPATPMSDDERWHLACLWNRFATRLGVLASTGSDGRIEISEAEHRDLLQRIEAGAPAPELLRVIGGWRLLPTEGRLQVLADQVQDLGRRLGKGPIRVTVEPNGLRVDRRRWAAFFGALVHVVRNAVDHGLEDQAERLVRCKPPVAQVDLRTFLCEGHFVVEVGDDGRGLDWQRIGARAAALGLAAQRREDLVEALFREGVSTREEVSEISGRGVGLGAVREECRKLGGRIQIDSEAGRGARFRFWFPVSAMGEPGERGPRQPRA